MTEQAHLHDLPPVKVGFIIDGVVVDVLHTDERLAAIFLSDPVIVNVTDWYADPANAGMNLVDATFDGSSFTLPAPPPVAPLAVDPIPAPAVPPTEVPPSPLPSWVWNAADGGKWEPPVPRPVDGKNYYWDEPTISWIEDPQAI